MKNYKKTLIPLLFTLCAIFLQPTTMLAKTRVTNATVQNQTGVDIEAVTVVHKYSNNFKDEHTWGNLKNTEKTTEPMKIRFNTGFGTTGQDWWFVTWKYKNNNKIYYTSPNNFRGAIDAVENSILKILPEIGKVAGKAIGELVGSPEAASSKVGEKITKAIGGALFNSGSTKGLKKHLLRAKDQQNGVSIIITKRSVKFHSRTGKSSTEGIKSYLIQNNDFEYEINRPGSDIANYYLPTADPKLCQNACATNIKCVAWTYVIPKATKYSLARCWLKNSAPSPIKNKDCISGVK